MNIRFCRTDEIEQVMRFFGEHWAPNHILSRHRVLMDWQHYDRQSDRYNIVIAVDDAGSIAGTLGFIPTSQFDPELRGDDTIWLTSWKVRDSAGTTGLGLQLQSFLERNVPHRMVGTVGNNEHAGKIYRALGYQTGTMRQFYTLDPGRDTFELCRVPYQQRSLARQGSGDAAQLSRLDAGELFDFSSQLSYRPPQELLPLKSPQYFVNRFLRHPVYKYHVYGVLAGGQPQALLALRCAEAIGQRAVRLVDFHGDPQVFATLGSAWPEILHQFDAEYLDIHCDGPLVQSMQAAGMTELDPAGDVIIPNYFEPFARQNVRSDGLTNLLLKFVITCSKPTPIRTDLIWSNRIERVDRGNFRTLGRNAPDNRHTWNRSDTNRVANDSAKCQTWTTMIGASTISRTLDFPGLRPESLNEFQ